MPTLPPEEKLALLDRLEAGLLGTQRRGRGGGAAARRARRAQSAAASMRRICSPRSSSTSTKLRYRDWDDLIDYCSLSAMPVGRFVLDVHGESRGDLAGQRCAVRGAADHQSSAGLPRRLPQSRPGLCSARCARRLRRRASRRSARQRASPALLGCLHGLAARTERLLSESDVLCVADRGLAARPRSLGHQHAGAPPHAHPDGARSAERSRSSRDARGCRPDAGRRLQRRVAAARPAPVR